MKSVELLHQLTNEMKGNKMPRMNKLRKGEFQEVKYGNYFTFGDLEDCPDDRLKNWAKEQSWYSTEIHYSFIDVDGWLNNPYRVAVIKQSVAYIYTYNIPNKTESYKDWEKWQIKNLVIYK